MVRLEGVPPDATDAELRARIKRELRSIQPNKLPIEWDDEASFRDDLGLDSLDLVEMVACLEQVTGIFVPDLDFPSLTSVASTADYLRARRLTVAADAAS